MAVNVSSETRQPLTFIQCRMISHEYHCFPGLAETSVERLEYLICHGSLACSVKSRPALWQQTNTHIVMNNIVIILYGTRELVLMSLSSETECTDGV